VASAALSKRALHRLALHRRDSIGAAYHVLTFDAEQPLEVAAGQFAMVRGAAWGDAPLLPRPMSLLTGGHRPSILIKVVGEGTRRFAHASGGEPFDLLAPLGVPWSACPADRTPLLVAGGVGVAPLVFLARQLADRKPLTLYGGRTIDDLPLHEELAGLGELRVTTEDGSRGTRGRVTIALEVALDEMAKAGKPPKIYCCGPDRMMAAVAAICAQRSVDCEVSLETPMACGYGVCLGCPVKKSAGGYLYACTEGPCIAAERIDWQAAR
jgi:dihydroorotate dehydrogenase electron transfer subunit